MRNYFSLVAFIAVFFSLLWREVGSEAFSQDFHLSQYDEAPLNLNPALTGFYNGTFRIHSHYRTQWNSIANHPFTTTLLSGEQHLKKISLGAQIADERAGAGDYSVFSLQLSAAYDKPLNYKKTHRISAGIQAGFEYKSVNLSKLIFESQYVGTNGGGFDNTLSNGEPNIGQQIFLPDINFGLMYYYAKNKSRINPFLGATAFHLTNPKESFFSESNKLPLRYLIHGGCKINIADRIQFVPKFLLMKQINDYEMVAGMDVNYALPNTVSFLILGASYRNKDAIIYFAGLKYGRATYKVSYDINNSSLSPATMGRGGFEISFTVIGSRYKPTPIPNCPRPI
ncbi:MAG: PorP/SprF family type IX secretion system membrane protein [Bacteroidetes bacterium]|nr:PorP/SprF family type IX secretion system membrane protein [Bacteroidota bacterium]